MPSSQLPLNPTTYYNQPYAIPFWHESLDRAYQEVLIAEQAAMTSHDEDKTINARVLGYFLLECFKRMHRFGPDAVDRIVVEIISMPTKPDTTTQDVIYGLGAEYRAYLLRGSVSYSFRHYFCRLTVYCQSEQHRQLPQPLAYIRLARQWIPSTRKF